MDPHRVVSELSSHPPEACAAQRPARLSCITATRNGSIRRVCVGRLSSIPERRTRGVRAIGRHLSRVTQFSVQWHLNRGTSIKLGCDRGQLWASGYDRALSLERNLIVDAINRVY